MDYPEGSVKDPEFRFPVGWDTERKVMNDSAGGSVQRPYREE